MSVTDIQPRSAGQLPTPLLQWWPAGRPDELHTVWLPLAGTFVIGRADGCDLELSDNAQASRIHAELQVHSGRVRLVDLGSMNCTYVNGTRVSSVWLRHGDQVRIGTTCLSVHYPELPGGPTAPVNNETAATVIDPYAQLRAELIKLDARYRGHLGAVKKKEVERLLSVALGCSPRTVERMFSAVASQLHIDATGSELVAAVADRLCGRA